MENHVTGLVEPGFIPLAENVQATGGLGVDVNPIDICVNDEELFCAYRRPILSGTRVKTRWRNYPNLARFAARDSSVSDRTPIMCLVRIMMTEIRDARELRKRYGDFRYTRLITPSNDRMLSFRAKDIDSGLASYWDRLSEM